MDTLFAVGAVFWVASAGIGSSYTDERGSLDSGGKAGLRMVRAQGICRSAVIDKLMFINVVPGPSNGRYPLIGT